MKLDYILSFIFGTSLGWLVLQTAFLGFITGIFGVLGNLLINYVLKQAKLKRDNATKNRINDAANREADKKQRNK
jgi:hypothetical protein